MMTIINKIFLNTVPMAFLKWKTMAKMKQSDFTKYITKTQKIANILQRFLLNKQKQSRKAFEK